MITKELKETILKLIISPILEDQIIGWTILKKNSTSLREDAISLIGSEGRRLRTGNTFIGQWYIFRISETVVVRTRLNFSLIEPTSTTNKLYVVIDI